MWRVTLETTYVVSYVYMCADAGTGGERVTDAPLEFRRGADMLLPPSKSKVMVRCVEIKSHTQKHLKTWGANVIVKTVFWDGRYMVMLT